MIHITDVLNLMKQLFVSVVVKAFCEYWNMSINFLNSRCINTFVSI